MLSASDAARAKIHPKLQRQIEQAPAGGVLRFASRIRVGTDLGMFADDWFARPFRDPLGLTVAAGLAKPSALLKMASLAGVVSLQPAESLVEPPAPPDPDVAEVRDASIEPKIRTAPDGSPGRAPTGWFHTGPALHGSQAAWSKGYTGAGVRFMSNDSGADYCHPDLAGTWAYIDDPSSPYHGLPEMFDSWSSFAAAFDHHAGTNLVAQGEADYADTSTVVRPSKAKKTTPQALEALYRPIGATAMRTYKLPATSKSGSYHIGSHPDRSLASVANVISQEFFKGDARAVRGERAGVLVVDEGSAGAYDTVYVDLNYDFDFRNDRPARLSRDFGYDETACLDYDGDGLNDISGGLVYFISDGRTAVPTLDWFWGVPGEAYGNGDLVAFHVQDFVEGSDHGQGTTSVATGQGVVAGSVYHGPGGPPQAGGQGLVVGPGRELKSTQNGNFFRSPFIEDPFIYAGLGYDGVTGTGDDIQLLSNSWGISAIDNDGIDLSSRLVDSINRTLAPHTAVLFSTGNGAPGYGTTTGTKPPSGIAVGASTLFDTVGDFEPMGSGAQMVGGDPMSWSNRGPGANNTAGPDVVATGAFGTGDLSLNQVLWGAIATADFGGTSMAAPVAAGNLALIYQAWRHRTGRWPTFAEAKELLMGSARNTEHDVWSQGAGLVDADRGTDVAAGLGGTYTAPSQWLAGDYRGTEHQAFPHVVQPGTADTQTFTLRNHGTEPRTVSLGSNRFTRLGTSDYSFSSLHQSLDHGQFTTPDYMRRIDQDIPEGTDLLQVRVTKPHHQFDPDENLAEPFNNWDVLLHNWTDLDRDGRFWADTNANTKVDVGETDLGEYVRFNYGYNYGPTQQARIGNPLERAADGILLSFRHRSRLAEVPTTDLTVEVSYWKRVPWEWVGTSVSSVEVPAGGSATFDATITVPSEADAGMYEGAVVANDRGRETIIPITAAVAAAGTRLAFGGSAPQDALYDNGHLFGYTDYRWRAESGDWRFFWTDIGASDLPASGTSYLVVDNAWASPGTDIDSVVLGPTVDPFSARDVAVYGPYRLDPVGGSLNTSEGRGRWRFQTSSGGPREVVAVPANEGLHALLLHQVRVDGRVLDEPFSGATGRTTLDPGVAESSSATGSSAVNIETELALEGLQVEGFGLSAPLTTRETAYQDDPDDITTASFTRSVTVRHGGLLDVSTSNAAQGSDIDLYVYGPTGELLGGSLSPTDDERVTVRFPVDGTYTIAVHGWDVAAGSDAFDLTVDAVQGHDVAVTSPGTILADGSATLNISWDARGRPPGVYNGLVALGPREAQGLFLVPVRVTLR